MSEDSEQILAEQPSTVETLSHRRILLLMAVVGALGAIAGFAFISVSFGVGVFIGGILSLVNYYWIKQSLKSIFDTALSGGKPQFLGLQYFFRYLTLGAILVFFYLTKSVPMVAVLLGLASFALAIIFEAMIRLFSSFSTKKEI
jgi:hypothetical protein